MSSEVGDGARGGVARHPWWAWTTGPRGWLTLIVICLTVYLPGLTSIAPIDRDESRFAQASRQMFESVALPKELRDPAMHSGGLAVPMVQDRPRLNKPPLVYWLQAASAAVFTGGDPLKDHIWMYRVPGVLCAIASVLITWRLGRRMFDPRAAWLGAVVLGVCPLVVVDAHMARADQLLLTTVVAGQYWLWRAWRGSDEATKRRSDEGEGSSTQRGSDGATKRRSDEGEEGSRPSRQATLVTALCFWICIGASVLAKGPIGPMVIGLTALMLAALHGRAGLRWLWSLRPLTGVVIVLAMCLPWLWMVGEHVGWQKYFDTIFKETITRSLEPKEGHWGPPGYHLVLMVALLWPGSMLTGVGVVRALRVGWPRVVEKGQAASRWWKRRGGRDAEMFCIAWIVPAWIVFELVSTKLPHYTMPMYPALALLSGRAVMSAAKLLKNDRLARLGAMACVWAGLLPLVAWLAFVSSLLTFSTSVLTPTWVVFSGGVAALFLTVLAILWVKAVRAADQHRWLRSQWLTVCSWVPIAAMLFGLFGEWLMPGSTTRQFMRALNRVDDWRIRPIASVYHEDSLIFSTRGRVERVDEEHALEWLRDHPSGLLICPRDLVRPKDVDSSFWSGYINPQFAELGHIHNSLIIATPDELSTWVLIKLAQPGTTP